ncbi:hypothetical protein ACJMK2_035147 [Sinanodonta woodiana]|uniref:THAP-type domain-containing protein n=1 Tax=Sinanodonta woodiana TaxID=1069815 RepID=A0ABD3WVF9_SINWO
MVYCVAFNCKTGSGQGVGLFEFPKDEKRRKVWISRIKRKDFRPSKTSRLCAKHFTNDQFVVDPLLAMRIGYKLRKLQLKSDAIPSVFDFEVKKKGNDNADSFKRKQRQSGAVAKRKKIETLAQILEVSSDSDQNDNTCTINEGKETPHESNTEQLTATYNASCQTTSASKNSSCQTEPCMVTVGTQTDDRWETRRSYRSPSIEMNRNQNLQHDTSQDPDWCPSDQEESIDSVQVTLLNRKCSCCGTMEVLMKRVVGTALIVDMCCKCDGRYKWYSQPMSGTMPLGNLILSGAIMFAGASPTTVLNVLMHSKIQCFSQRTYMSIQNAYIVPIVSSVWQLSQSYMLDEIRDRGSAVKLGGDARCCSPGHTAKYGSYSIMNLESGKILDLQLVQSNEVNSSYAMELEGLKRCLAFLSSEDVTVSHLITDRHSQVKKYLKDKHPEIMHMFDVWHVAKGVYKKLEAAGKRKGCDVVGRWARSISNHMYWCAASSCGDGEVVQQKWFSILNHVANIHRGHGDKFLQCEHEELDNREWIKYGSKAHTEVKKVVKGRLLATDIKKLSPAEQTSSLESFHRVICFFEPKSLHFFHAQMEASHTFQTKLVLFVQHFNNFNLSYFFLLLLYLATLHFNENVNRVQAVTLDGSHQYRVSFPKGRKGEGVAKEIKTRQTYNKREMYTSYSEAFDAKQREDKVRPAPLAQALPRQSKNEIVNRHISRFNLD